MWWTMSPSKLWETVKDREAWHAAIHGVADNLVTEQQQHVWGRFKSLRKGHGEIYRMDMKDTENRELTMPVGEADTSKYRVESRARKEKQSGWALEKAKKERRMGKWERGQGERKKKKRTGGDDRGQA